MQGPPDTPYETGHFLLQLLLSKNYPFEPPKVQFKTFIYHPNIDDKGRICLDLLKSGTWSSASNIQSTLMTIYSLLRNPNPDDPLSIEAANEYKRERYIFDKKAMEFTKKYA
ncbi:putative ubiquitin conjugating enzyme E2, partial [Neoconidiobolus thromboides FSU 785]